MPVVLHENNFPLLGGQEVMGLSQLLLLCLIVNCVFLVAIVLKSIESSSI